jgi:hypothetical protein
VDPLLSRARPHLRSSGAAALLAVALGLCATAARADFFSPGELSRAHASLEGLKNCTQCHEAGQKLSQEKCLSCHTELAGSLRDRRGFHGRIPAAERACETCHSEHHGRDAALIDWGPKKQAGFEHASRTGFALEGEHARAGCEKCHEPRLIVDDTVRAMLKKQPGRKTFLGLPTACNLCHYDEHRGQLGARCEQCHTPKAWKPAPGFDHGKTDFALEGAHRKVDCQKCHTATQTAPAPAGAFPAPRSATFTKFEDLPHARCQDCHEDPHKGRFGERCESCHTVESWHQVRDAAKERAFHDKTRFPLKGSHLDVACKSCHGPFPGRPARFQGLAFRECSDCHADAHLGQLAEVGGKKPDCDQCHAVDGFTPARFGLEAHAKTRYPLEGSHRAVACIGCHREEQSLSKRIPPAVRQELARKKRPALFSFMLFDFPQRLDRCETCHADPHAGQLPRNEGCRTCHQVDSFHALSFQHDRDTRFPLTGKHASVACALCHPTVKVNGRELTRYKPLEATCTACHEDVHAGQLATAPGEPTDCTRCHDTAAFQQTKFTHTPPFTGFLLEGRHASLSCEKCHPSVAVGGGREIRKYQGTPRTCEGCHADAHHGAFQGFQP